MSTNINQVTLPSVYDNSLRLPFTTQLDDQTFAGTALLDTGADGLFINEKVVKKYQLPTIATSKVIECRNANGSSIGKITRQVCLPLTVGPQTLTVYLLVTNLGSEIVILGLPWFKVYQPTINWSNGKVTIRKIALDPLLSVIPKPYHDFIDIFKERPTGQLPPRRSYDHKIVLKPDFVPKRFRHYPLSIPQQSALREFLDENLRNRYIRRSKSPMASPLFFVKKKNGKLRAVQDYRYLNQGTIKNAYPLPLISSLFEDLRTAKWFTTLDIRWGYNNIRLRRRDRWKAAFIVPAIDGNPPQLFEPRVMFFGLCNSPATFQAFMNHIFRHLIKKRYVLIYMDDLFVMADNLPQLIHRTRLVFQTMRKHDLHLNPEKCHFHKQEVQYLGFVIRPGQLLTDPAKVDTILKWPQPINAKEIRKFTGFTNYYRQFIRNYALITKPLDNLKRKSQPFCWTTDCQNAFDYLKQCFTQAPILHIPDPTKPFILEVDASLFATGGTLFQMHDGQPTPLPCGYISKALDQAQRNYHIYDRELLAVVRGLQNWKHLLLGSPHKVTVWTDHKNLLHWQQPQKLNPRQARWLLFVSQFDLDLIHKPGRSMIFSDAFTRRPDYIKEGKAEITEESVMLPPALFHKTQISQIFINAIHDPSPDYDDLHDAHLDAHDLKTKILQAYHNDDEIDQLLTKLKNKLPPLRTKLHDWYLSDDNLLYYKKRIYIPNDPHLRRSLIYIHHDLPQYGHPGIYGTLTAIHRHFYWYGMGRMVTDYVRGCAICQQMKINTHPTVPPLHPIQAKRSLPFATVNMDFITDLPNSNGYTCILVVVDHDCTKAIKLIPCDKTVNALQTAQLYFDHVYRHYGLPEQIISDRGPQFASHVFQELCNLTGIRSTMSTAYHPQTDGQAERANQEIELYLRIYCAAHPELWAHHLSFIEFSHNNRTHSVTKRTPFQLLMGYEPRAIPIKIGESKVPSIKDRLLELVQQREEAQAAHDEARFRMEDRITSNFKPFKRGQKVWLEATNIRTPGRPAKFRPKREGPFEIQEVLSPLVYRLKIPSRWNIHPVFHATLLTPYRETTTHGPTYSQPPPDQIEGEEEWEVEAIIAHRYKGKRREYLVQWQGYPPSEATWEPEANLKNALDVLNQYKKKHRL